MRTRTSGLIFNVPIMAEYGVIPQRVWSRTTSVTQASASRVTRPSISRAWPTSVRVPRTVNPSPAGATLVEANRTSG